MSKEVKKELADEKLDKVAGGLGGYVNPDCTYEINAAIKYCNDKGWRYMKKYYPCPVCGSKNVMNYDPGELYLMRVICNECGSFKDRKGGSPY